MPVVINDFELAPAPAQPASEAPKEQGGDSVKPETLKQVGKILRLEQERQRRLAAY
jgi:hypothetical protein